MEEDKSKNCVKYPHGKLESYNDCDEDFLISAIPANLVPIWSAKECHHKDKSIKFN